MSKIAKWKPRGSAIGHYMACTMRAAFDRALHDGLLELDPVTAETVEKAKQSSPYADLGTAIHHHLQAGIGAQFIKPGSDAGPTTEQLVNASALFDNDMTRTSEAIRRSAVRAAKDVLAFAPGDQWFAEIPVKTRHMQGTIDLLTRDLKHLMDLKTTAKPPLSNRIKQSHLVQTLAYVDAIEQDNGDNQLMPKVEKLTVLYVDSLNAGWSLPITVDLTLPAIIEYRLMIRDFVAYLHGAQLLKTCHPNIGHACEEWCPWTSMCRDKYQTAAGNMSATPTPKFSNPLTKGT